jgi:hypothetical protein
MSVGGKRFATAAPNMSPSRALSIKSRRRESAWLARVATTIRARLAPRFGSMLAEVSPVPKETDATSDGWWVAIGALHDGAILLNIFIDNSDGDDRRSIWYGVSTRRRDGIEEIERAGRARWPQTQRVGYELPGTFRYEDPWLQHYTRTEHYYGWSERDEPDVTRPMPTAVADRIVERFTGLLLAISGLAYETESRLSRLERLDAEQQAVVRLEQSIVRSELLKGRESAPCALCGHETEAGLLVAAHIKRRADASDEERRAVKHNVMALCALGCDSLFERGYVTVVNGSVTAGPRIAATVASLARVATLKGRRCAAWTSESEPFFNEHRKRHVELWNRKP